jgi:hypothetical protein
MHDDGPAVAGRNAVARLPFIRRASSDLEIVRAERPISDISFLK